MRDRFFTEILGHIEIIEALSRAFLGRRMAHAYLFSGAAGIGKYKTARAFARMLQCNCEQKGHCLACKSTEDDLYPDILTIAPQGATIKIEQIREIQRDIRFAPKTGNYKVFIFDGAEKLTTQAANSLLKMLEEPPQHVIFLLLTAQFHSVLPTILSRCQHITFAPVSEQDIVDWLTNRGFPANKAMAAAVISGGIPGRAVLWAEDGQVLRDQVFEYLETLQQSPPGHIWDTVAKLDLEREQLITIMEIISIVLRDCVVWKTTGEPGLLLYQDCERRVTRLAQKVNLNEILAVSKEIEDLKRMVLGNANSRLVLEKLCLRLQDALATQGGVC